MVSEVEQTWLTAKAAATIAWNAKVEADAALKAARAVEQAAWNAKYDAERGILIRRK